jgi:hypothetical protein
VALALDQLGRAAARPDGLPNPAEGAATLMLVHEVAPRWDDAGRIGADIGHVGEIDPIRISIQLRTQQVDLGRADNDQHRLPGNQTFADERQRALDELVLA